MNTMDYSEENAGTSAICQENLLFVLAHVKNVYSGYQEKVQAFNRSSYPGAFERHKEENYAFYSSLKLILNHAEEEELDNICHQIAGALVKEQEEALSQVQKRNEKTTLQMEKNLFTAIYLLPAIKGIQSGRADRLADIICAVWRKAFKNSNISASNYEGIMEGFKNKLCYVTTAVCTNLEKGTDCEELRLIKEFRDGYLSSTKEGLAMIEEYYDIAPTLVKRIERDKDAHDQYVSLWNTYLSPCVEYIKNGQPEICREIYCSMMEELRERYLIGQRLEGVK